MGGQLTSLNADIQERAIINDFNNAIANALQQKCNNSNRVGTLGIRADGGYNQQRMQDLINKVDELIKCVEEVRGALDHGGGTGIDEGVGSLMLAGFVQKNVTVGGARGIRRNHERGETPSLLP